jgi:hypothetical protein
MPIYISRGCYTADAVRGMILVAMAGGSVSHVQTTVAMTSKQAIEAFSGAAAAAKSFKSAGK